MNADKSYASMPRVVYSVRQHSKWSYQKWANISIVPKSVTQLMTCMKMAQKSLSSLRVTLQFLIPSESPGSGPGGRGRLRPAWPGDARVSGLS